MFPGEKIPRHIAVIMDGNGRWAEERGYTRVKGHREGANRVDELVTECRRLGVRYLTLYAFSTENWRRPTHEVGMLMRLLVQYLRRMDKKLFRNEVSLSAMGSVNRLPAFVQGELRRVLRFTQRENPAMTLNLCVSYGGRQEIVDAVRAIGQSIQRGTLKPEDITESVFSQFLYRPEIPDPDLLIRTGGESRVSNFLLWEIAYSEIYVTPVLWPEFRIPDFHEALQSFSTRQRRFGLTPSQLSNTPALHS